MTRAPALRAVAVSLVIAACSHPNPPPVCPQPPAAPEVGAAAPAAPPVAVAPPAVAPIATQPSGYNQPPQNVLDVLHAPTPPYPTVAPTGDRILLVAWTEYAPIAQVAEPYLKLGGVRLEPRTRRKHDTPGGYGVVPCARSISIVDVASGHETAVQLPAGGCADEPVWSADGQRFAFQDTSQNAVELWVGNTSGQVHRVGDVRLNPMLDGAFEWMPDQKSLLVKTVPANQGPAPELSVTAVGPSIQETGGQSGESSTYETRDTLTSKHDEDLFDYYGASQLAIVDADSGAARPLGAAGIYASIDPSPDGQHIFVDQIHKPYSYVTTSDHFAHDAMVWDTTGASHVIAKLPVADRVPIAGVETGPRDFQWRATAPATLVWAEALDGGDPLAKATERDKLMALAAPFAAAPAELMRTEQRFAGIGWSEQQNVQLVTDVDVNRHWRRVFVTDIDAKTKPRAIVDQSTDELYKNPGRPVYRLLTNGAPVIRQDGDTVYWSGQGASPDGDRPFLDAMDIKTGKTQRMFRSDQTAYERFMTFATKRGAPELQLLTWRQSADDPPNAFLRIVGPPLANAPAGEASFTTTPHPITHIPDPTPQVRAIKKQLYKYKRKDGVELSFTLFTPPGYQPGTKLPAILYAYPLDYASAATAGQHSGSEQRFTSLRDYQLLLLSGYAIIDMASFPIVGDPKKAYDTYLEQLVADAQAAVDKAVETGVVDRDRIGVTGHSHGALMTANLIAHTDLFRAGVATSGSYNKTLTPFGFQNERRSVWKAQPVYLKVSPFFFADKIKLPLLIVHGADDANPGTTPLQAVKLYEAIRGNGGTARLVMLPHEPHWYSAMESNEQLAYEELRWFDKYVKNATPREHGGGAKGSAAHKQ